MISLRKQVADILQDAIAKSAKNNNLSLPENFSVRIDYPPDANMGAYASPIAMELARAFKKNPGKIAQDIVDEIRIGPDQVVRDASVVGPGFINISLSPWCLLNAMVTAENTAQWCVNPENKLSQENTIFEYVSANPTGPLNVVSARAASVGDSLCRILKATGKKVCKEYYVNDYGNQVEMLGLSFAIRYLEKKSVKLTLPENAYQGEYIITFLDQLLEDKDLSARLTTETLHLKNSDDALSWAQSKASWFSKLGVERILKSQKEDLARFGVEFDAFFSETTLHEMGKVQSAFETLKKRDYITESNGAMVFKSTEFGDDKDRVVIRSDGRPTYLLADIAYHYDKIERGFNQIFDIWGPDHHGYIRRLQGAIQATGFGKANFEKFEVIIAQQVNLLEDGVPVVMSKRLGKFQTMRDLLDKIPVDVLRYFFVMRGLSTHLDFDLELALNQTAQNPVYYIQYAHARIHSIFRELGVQFESLSLQAAKPQILSGKEYLEKSHRTVLISFILRYPEILEDISRNLEAQRLPEYLTNLARLFTSFYHAKENNIKNLTGTDKQEADFLLHLCRLCALTLSHGLSLLGISSPREM